MGKNNLIHDLNARVHCGTIDEIISQKQLLFNNQIKFVKSNSACSPLLFENSYFKKPYSVSEKCFIVIYQFIYGIKMKVELKSA